MLNPDVILYNAAEDLRCPLDQDVIANDGFKLIRAGYVDTAFNAAVLSYFKVALDLIAIEDLTAGTYL